MTCQGIAVLNHTFIDITSIPWVITSNPLVLWVSLRSYMDQKFPLYVLYLSIARKFAAVHEPSPLDLEEADIQISLCEQIVPCIHLFTKHFLSACSVPGNAVGISKTYSSFLGLQFTLIGNPCACMHAWSLSHVQLFVNLWTIAHQAPLSVGFSSKNTAVGCHFLPPKAWVRLNGIKHGSTNLLDRKQFTRPRQSVLPTMH